MKVGGDVACKVEPYLGVINVESYHVHTVSKTTTINNCSIFLSI